MNVDIFIRTYSGDIEILQYCLRSIEKYCTGFRDIVITIPAKDRNLLGYNPKYKVFTVPHYQEDYLGQQVSKLQAHHFSLDSDFILYVDSDCVFTEPVAPESFLKDGKPFILKTKYTSMDGDVLGWQGITEKALGFKIEYEYMRRLPLMYHTQHLSQLQNFLQMKHTAKLETYIINQPQRAFSEFNVLGAFCDKYYSNMYVFHDTDLGFPENVLIQFWSHDWRNGNKDKIIETINNALNGDEKTVSKVKNHTKVNVDLDKI